MSSSDQVRTASAYFVPDTCVIPPAKFHISGLVQWFRVPTQDFGIVVERFYDLEGSVQALGWHYLIQLDPRSPSFAHCKFDLGFEDDLAVMEMEKDGDATESDPN